MALENIKTNTLGMPLIGFGTYTCTKEEGKAAVLEALRAGYRHIDTAECYKNEDVVGEAIKESEVAREDIFICSKVFPGRDEWEIPEKTYDQTIETFMDSRRKLQIKQLDLYLIHAPTASNQRIEQWRALVDLQKKGLIKHIGVSNYGIHHLKEIQSAGLPLPAVNQIEIHPLCQQKQCIEFMKEHNIEIVAYSSLLPLSTWRLAEGMPDASNTMERKKHCWEKIQSIATKHNIDQAKVLLKWALQHNYCILPKSSKPDRIRDNLDLFGFELDKEDMATLDAMDENAAMAWNKEKINPMEIP